MYEAESEFVEWIEEGAMSKVRESQEVPEPRLMSMRWVLTWKPSDEHPQSRKAKARIVTLGYQHPEVTELTASSPALSRHGKMPTLQSTAFNHAELECADAKSAFFQGDGHEMQDMEAVYARGLDDVACAMNIPLESA